MWITTESFTLWMEPFEKQQSKFRLIISQATQQCLTNWAFGTLSSAVHNLLHPPSLSPSLPLHSLLFSVFLFTWTDTFPAAFPSQLQLLGQSIHLIHRLFPPLTAVRNAFSCKFYFRFSLHFFLLLFLSPTLTTSVSLPCALALLFSPALFIIICKLHKIYFTHNFNVKLVCSNGCRAKKNTSGLGKYFFCFCLCFEFFIFFLVIRFIFFCCACGLKTSICIINENALKSGNGSDSDSDGDDASDSCCTKCKAEGQTNKTIEPGRKSETETERERDRERLN